MHPDEQAIRVLIASWNAAARTGDLATILALMTDDVVFLRAGHPPMRGRVAFAAASAAGPANVRIELTGLTEEVQVAGDFAFCVNHLDVTVTVLPDGTPLRRAGSTLTVFRKQADGKWLLARDANMLTVVQ